MVSIRRSLPLTPAEFIATCAELVNFWGDASFAEGGDLDQGRSILGPKDVAVDSVGHVYVADPSYVGNERRNLDFEGVFLIETNGFVTLLVSKVLTPNGLALSPDENTLYVSDNGAKRRVLIAPIADPRARSASRA